METARSVGGEQGTPAGSNGGGRDRRVDDRFTLDCAPGSLLYKGTRIPCEMLDISLSGCRLRPLQPFSAAALESVRVTLSIEDMVLSIWGITQWITLDQVVGIRFIHPTDRTRNELAGLLTCLLDKSVADVVKAAVAGAQTHSPIIALAHPPAVEPNSDVEESVEDGGFQEPPAPQPPAKRAELRSEYMVLHLKAGESHAMLHLVAESAVLAGDVLDVSQDGCLVRLARPTVVRLNAQAEVDFHLRGLTFRLPGVTREMHDERLVEIQFSEISGRKHADLSQVIVELIALSEA